MPDSLATLAARIGEAFTILYNVGYVDPHEQRKLDKVHDDARAALAELVERAERLERVGNKVDHIFHGLQFDANDGEFALWSETDLINALLELRAALSSPVHIFYGYAKRRCPERPRCMYCNKRRTWVAFTYFGAPVCGDCWDSIWRKTEDGECDPPFDAIKNEQSGEWIVPTDEMTLRLLAALSSPETER